MVHTVEQHGVIAVFALMAIESACLPVPAEVTMMIAGLLVSRGHANMFVMIGTGIVGNVTGSVIIWWVGRSGGRALLIHYGRWVGIKEHHVELVERWFDRYGIHAVLFSRNVPIVRTFASLPAGIAGMRFLPFSIATAVGCIPFVTAFAFLGYFIGDRWQQIHDDFRYINGAIIVLIALAIAWFVYRRWRRRRAMA